ncbi:unnamed protein product [Allacma fusca]|uniref:Uncharacterized protein n=1 Tax=Allacma fusca TaxID=39272 RepID=A0A8J2PRK0_9HEXA|nr:unnamed protein product [Allacma fusca]
MGDTGDSKSGSNPNQSVPKFKLTSGSNPVQSECHVIPCGRDPAHSVSQTLLLGTDQVSTEPQPFPSETDTVVKKAARTASTAIDDNRRKTITSAEEFYAHTLQISTTTKVTPILVTKSDISRYEDEHKLHERYASVETIKGTQKCYGFEPLDSRTLNMQEFSCSSTMETRTVFPDNAGDLVQETSFIFGNAQHLRIGDYCAFTYRKSFFIGMIMEIKTREGTDEIENIEAQLMKTGANNRFTWYSLKIVDFNPQVVLAKIQVPSLHSTTRFYTIDNDE